VALGERAETWDSRERLAIEDDAADVGCTGQRLRDQIPARISCDLAADITGDTWHRHARILLRTP